ncbi:MAG: radical SAM protein, partial [Pseudodesulfovibrio sp.]|nr:radical SAM protein [Pseudodesulfovibrio sp.]
MSIPHYQLLPFRFRKIDDEYLLISETGQFHFVSRDDLQRLIHNKLDPSESVFFDLKSKDIICLEYNSSIIKILAAKYRTKKKHIFDSTALHMMVLTYRCNQRCLYCHASSESDLVGSLDMSIETAKQCLNFAFETPSPYIKIEFQGGEPTLNFATLEASVQYAQDLAKARNKTVEFVVCTNLFDLDDSKLNFLYENEVQVSTSLDGPKELHDHCRPSATDSGSYDRFCINLFRVRDRFEGQIPSALLTVSRHNLKHLKPKSSGGSSLKSPRQKIEGVGLQRW